MCDHIGSLQCLINIAPFEMWNAICPYPTNKLNNFVIKESKLVSVESSVPIIFLDKNIISPCRALPKVVIVMWYVSVFHYCGTF